MEFVYDENDDTMIFILYWNGINCFISSFCSFMLFHFNNDLWYDISRFFQCYCCYDCCWNNFDCFIWDENKNCYTYICGKLCNCLKDKDHDSDDDGEDDDDDENDDNINQELDDNNNGKNDNDSNGIYVRGSLRRLHQK